MLSRIAENIYWMARYLERAESTARLVKAANRLFLDMPKHIISLSGGWEQLPIITGSEEVFQKQNKQADRVSVLSFLLDDHDNPGSIRASLAAAKINLRITRGVFPSRIWQYLSHMSAQMENPDPKDDLVSRFDAVIQQCEKITGLLMGSMSKDVALDFFQLGRNLEQADMLTRILDVRGVQLMRTSGDALLSSFENSQWRMVLTAVNGLQMYRQSVSPRVNAEPTLEFLLRHNRFPRSVRYCLLNMDSCLVDLARSASVRQHIRQLEEKLFAVDYSELVADSLHNYLDHLQKELAKLHNTIHTTYFDIAVQLPSQQQTQTSFRMNHKQNPTTTMTNQFSIA
ncbi:MAG: alpha-E domain-containing protein [Magnetococcales bacterium]|nr:alpha-E domain-containing protein [Magnetococcales bacterium]